uniref:Uncharacterized protein n=1 Tax=Catharus ustulatus TaxID=91951 RepID=A0A8C3V3C2_CATUS
MSSWSANRARVGLCHSSPRPSPGTLRGRVGAPWLTPVHSLLQSYLVRDQVPNFLWTIRLSNIDQQLLTRIDVVNRYPHEGTRLMLSRGQREQCQDLLQRLEEQLPQLGIEGNLNIWILKPSAKSRGRGKLTQSCTSHSLRVCEWVVQKYVERPLTIFNTKFDIRQWFVVTDWKPLTVWFYRECYLRFCSQPFSLCHLDARHLCNVSIQKRYKTLQQDPRVPPDKIWSNKQFQAHLAQMGQADAWQQVMVPGMKAAILNALRCARDQVGSRKGSFELFGADFLIGEDFRPWLLEVNSCPTMSPSSAVTRQLCANVQRDTLRLVLDRKDDPRCSIGAFELLYREVGWGLGTSHQGPLVQSSTGKAAFSGAAEQLLPADA